MGAFSGYLPSFSGWGVYARVFRQPRTWELSLFKGIRFCVKPVEVRWVILIWVFPKIVVPPNGRFIMENPIKMDDLGGFYPYFWFNTHLLLFYRVFFGCKVTVFEGAVVVFFCTDINGSREPPRAGATKSTPSTRWVSCRCSRSHERTWKCHLRSMPQKNQQMSKWWEKYDILEESIWKKTSTCES